MEARLKLLKNKGYWIAFLEGMKHSKESDEKIAEEIISRIESLSQTIHAKRVSDEKRACPCLYGEPCNPRCTCIDGFSSRGCNNCCTYGSVEQREGRAKTLKCRTNSLHAKSVSEEEIESEAKRRNTVNAFITGAKWMQNRLSQTIEGEEEVIYFCKRTMGRDNPIPHCMDWCGDETCRLYTNDQKKEKEEKGGNDLFIKGSSVAT